MTLTLISHKTYAIDKLVRAVVETNTETTQDELQQGTHRLFDFDCRIFHAVPVGHNRWRVNIGTPKNVNAGLIDYIKSPDCRLPAYQSDFFELR